MTYNLDFLYAAIVICVLVLCHFFIGRRNYHGKLPQWVASVVSASLIVTLVDIVDSIFIEHAAQVNVFALYAIDIFLYIAQLTLPFLLYMFSLTITGNLIKGQRRFAIFIPIALYIVTCVFVILTPLTGLVFSFDIGPGHAYSHGSMFYLMYSVGVILGLCVLGLMVANRKYLRSSDCLIICLDVVIIFAVSVIQTFVPHLCLIGFGAACGALALYVGFTDSSGLGDTKTGAFESKELRRRIALLANRGSYYDATFIAVNNRRYLSNSIGSDAVDEALRLIAYELMEIYDTEQVYKFQGARFCVLTYDASRTKALSKVAEEWLSERHEIGINEITFDARVSTLFDVNSFAADLDLEIFINFLVDELGTAKSNDVDQKALMRSYVEFRDANVALKSAIVNDTFEIFMQPLYNIETGKFSSVEVLSRMKDEDGRYIPPSLFIGIAEDNGSIRTVSRMQFRRLCRFISENRARLERLGVTDFKYNVSSAEITTSDRAAHALDVIEAYGLDPKMFTFEITENVAYAGSQTLLNMMHEVRDAGCRVYMDDFGSGYANLETVFNTPFDGVKLDITLLRLIRSDERAKAFYQSLVHTLHALGLTIVSEGVEEADEVACLTEWGVDVIQGYYYSKPLPEAAYFEFLEAHAK